MNKLLIASLTFLLFSAPAFANYPPTLYGPNNSTFYFYPPDILADFHGPYCEDKNYLVDGTTNFIYRMSNCSTTPVYTQVFPILPAQMDVSSDIKNLMGQSNNAGFIAALGLTSYNDEMAQDAVGNAMTGGGNVTVTYNDGANTIAIESVVPIFQYPGAGGSNPSARALNSCFQISAGRDADFHYKVDVTTGLSLTSGAQGTVTATSYTNSGCTTGAQAISDGTSAQTGSLVIGLNISQIISVSLNGELPAGKWLKITTANNVGTPTFGIRSVQSEILH